MIESQQEKLLKLQSDYLSIGVTEDGQAFSVIGVPWVRTSHAFNMKLPDIYITPEDLSDEKIVNALLEREVLGCYIYAPLKDYDFLSRFVHIRDLSIKNGDNVRSLDFLKNLTDCSMLFLQNAQLENLDIIMQMRKAKKSIFGGFNCVGLDNCTVQDLSIFEREKHCFSEFLVWGDINQKDRWAKVVADTKRFYEI